MATETTEGARPATDATLSLVAKMDRMMAKVPEEQRVWALSFLWGKHGRVPFKALVESAK